jgi:GTP cyclohydrolase II
MTLMSHDPLARAASGQANVERCIAELRRGGASAILHAERALLAIAAEMVEEAALAWLASVGAPGSLRLLLTGERARHLGVGAAPGLPSPDWVVCRLPEAVTAATLRHLADPVQDLPEPGASGLTLAADLDPELVDGAIELAKAARLLPAMVAIGAEARNLGPLIDEAFVVDSNDIRAGRRALSGLLRRVGSARVPLSGAEEAEIIAFRPADGGKEHLAIVIGRPDPGQPVLVRLHSECFTGDLLGSLRCDCGDQLRGAIGAIASAGSGILLYLAQEGRGIGLINKLRAYQLQDGGADTLEANLQLGFGADERVYRPAAEMLRQLGISETRVLTNNPDKVRGLEQCGIRVVERVPHIFPSNQHNAQYLVTKARRFGHMF